VLHDVRVANVQARLNINKPVLFPADSDGCPGAGIPVLLHPWTLPRRARYAMVLLHLRTLLRSLLPCDGVAEREAGGRWLAG
jgi:hypothetical protein